MDIKPFEMKDKINHLRKLHGLTLEAVGIAVGVARSTVMKWERGDIANMKRDKIAKLAAVLHTSPSYLMGWYEEEESGSPLQLAIDKKMLKEAEETVTGNDDSLNTTFIKLYRQLHPNQQKLILDIIRELLPNK